MDAFSFSRRRRRAARHPPPPGAYSFAGARHLITCDAPDTVTIPDVSKSASRWWPSSIPGPGGAATSAAPPDLGPLRRP